MLDDDTPIKRSSSLLRLLMFMEENPKRAKMLVEQWVQTAQNSESRLICAECVKPVEDDYEVLDRVWHTAIGCVTQFGGYLHLVCLQKRLGRKLSIADFTAAPVNAGLRFGFGLAHAYA